MNTHFTRGMAKATELTRSGKLQEATAMIQSLLQHPIPVASHSLASPDGADEVIDSDFTRLEPDTPPPDAAMPKTKPILRCGL